VRRRQVTEAWRAASRLAQMFDPGGSFFLLKRIDTSWAVVEYAVGSTDLAWDGWRTALRNRSPIDTQLACSLSNQKTRNFALIGATGRCALQPTPGSPPYSWQRG